MAAQKRWEVAELVEGNPAGFLRSNPYILNILSDIEERREDDYILQNYSCFFFHPYFTDLFIVTQNKWKELDIEGDQIPIRLDPGHLYFVWTWSHEATIICLSEDETYYVDFYMETERENPFRFERIDKGTLEKYLTAIRGGDLEHYLRFHRANPKAFSFKKELVEHVLLEGISRAPITFVPTALDTIRVVVIPRESYRGRFDDTDYDRVDTNNDPQRQLRGYRFLMHFKQDWITYVTSSSLEEVSSPYGEEEDEDY